MECEDGPSRLMTSANGSHLIIDFSTYFTE